MDALKKNFGKLEVLKSISTDIYEGEVVVIVGPSGSGKSTFLRCLNGLEEITGGKVVVGGYSITDKKVDINKVRENIGMVFQHFNLFNNLNVIKNLMLAPVDLKKASKEEAREQALAMLARVGLEDKASAYPAQLSGGQKQRLSIARALSRKPEILVFDDSFSALDYKTDAKLREGLNEKLGDTTKIIVAQRISTIRHADKIIVLDRGEAVGMGTHDELMKNCDVYKEIALSQLSAAELA